MAANTHVSHPRKLTPPPKKGPFQYESTLPTTSTTFNYYVSGGHVLVFQGSTGKKKRLGVTWTLLRSHCWMECWTSKLLSNSARMFSTLTFTNWNRFWWKVSWWSYMHRFCQSVPMMVICLTANIASKKRAKCSNQPRNSNQPAWNSDWPTKNQNQDGKARTFTRTTHNLLYWQEVWTSPMCLFSTQMTSPATLMTIRLQDSTRHPYLIKSLPLVFEVAKVAFC